MKAMALANPGQVDDSPLRLVDLPTPEPGPDEVLIRVEVCGVCRTDLHVVEGDLPPRRDRIIPGHEVVGTIERNGPGSNRFQAGARVGVAWLHRACVKCPYFRRGEVE